MEIKYEVSMMDWYEVWSKARKAINEIGFRLKKTRLLKPNPISTIAISPVLTDLNNNLLETTTTDTNLDHTVAGDLAQET